MRLNLYSVYDVVAGIYQHPMVLVNDAVAMRIVRNCVETKEHNFSLNPNDYSLYRLGVFDDTDGSISYKPEKMCELQSLVKRTMEVNNHEV